MNVVLCLPTYAAQNPALQRITGFYAMTTITHKTLTLPRPKKEATEAQRLSLLLQVFAQPEPGSSCGRMRTDR